MAAIPEREDGEVGRRVADGAAAAGVRDVKNRQESVPATSAGRRSAMTMNRCGAEPMKSNG